jgi:hypothetical protein
MREYRTIRARRAFTALKCFKCPKLFPSAGWLFRSLDQEAKLLNQCQRDGLAFSKHFLNGHKAHTSPPHLLKLVAKTDIRVLGQSDQNARIYNETVRHTLDQMRPSATLRFPAHFSRQECLNSTQQRRRS